MDLKEICIHIRQEIDQLEGIISTSLSSNVSFIESVVQYVIQNGGKRLRPILTILASRLAGYQGEAGISIGASVEFMHTASLLHDDVIDSAPLRRGRASINKKWGNHVSVLVGDFFYCRAMDILVGHGDLRVLRVITDAVTTTTEGEIFEIVKSNDLSITPEEYLKVISGKTAALIAAATQAGAILGKVSEEFEQALRNFGFHLGLAFQLMDDVLDYTADEAEFGKVNGIDLKEGKLTLPLIWALKKCNESEMRLIKNALIADDLEPSAFRDILGIIDRYDGARETIRLAKNYIEKAKEKILPFRPSIERETLLTIADYVVLRKN